MSTILAGSHRLAVDGGQPIRTRPMPGWPYFDEAELEVVVEVLRSRKVNYWTGEHGRAFEHEFADRVGSPYAVALANGTLALEIALRAVGVTTGSEVIVPSASFIATASAVVACGARPVVVDVDRDSQCLTAESVEPAISARTMAVVPVHLAGYPADMWPLMELARRRGLRVVEDCAQAHGAARGGHGVGTFGDIAAWSFCQDKIMTTAGEGGAVTTAEKGLWRRCWEYKDHGKSYQSTFERAHSPGFRWLHDSFGTNARMTEIQAAVGRSQLGKLDRWVSRRREHADTLRTALSELPAVRLPDIPADVQHAFYRFYVHLRPAHLRPGWDRDRVVAAICAEGVPCQHGGCTEIYRERAFDAVGRPCQPLPVAAELGRTSLTLPVHPSLDDRDVADVATAVRRVCEVATG